MPTSLRAVATRLEPAARRTAPIAVGHLAAMVLMAGAALWGASVDPRLWVVVALLALLKRSSHSRLAAGSFAFTALQGAGVALVPALLPLCSAGVQVGALAQPALLVAGGLVVHTALMLVVSDVLAGLGARVLRPWTAARPDR